MSFSGCGAEDRAVNKVRSELRLSSGGTFFDLLLYENLIGLLILERDHAVAMMNQQAFRFHVRRLLHKKAQNGA